MVRTCWQTPATRGRPGPGKGWGRRFARLRSLPPQRATRRGWACVSAGRCAHLHCMSVNLRCVRVRVSTAPGDVPGHSTSVPPTESSTERRGRRRPRAVQDPRAVGRQGSRRTKQKLCAREGWTARRGCPRRRGGRAGAQRLDRTRLQQRPRGGELAGLGRPARAPVRGWGRPAESCAPSPALRTRAPSDSPGGRAAWRRQPPVSIAPHKFLSLPPQPLPRPSPPAAYPPLHSAPSSPAPQGFGLGGTKR